MKQPDRTHPSDKETRPRSSTGEWSLPGSGQILDAFQMEARQVALGFETLKLGFSESRAGRTLKGYSDELTGLLPRIRTFLRRHRLGAENDRARLPIVRRKGDL